FFFFCRKGDTFHFIHRSFAEYLCLRDMLFEEDPDEATDMAARFPFERLRFQRLFAQEIRWLRFLPYRRHVSLCMDNYAVSTEDFQQSETMNWYDYYQSKSGATFSDFFQRLEMGKGRLVVRAKTADNGFLACIPFAEQIRELNLAHNNLQGDISLEHFARLETLDIAGNPALKRLTLPVSLQHIVVDKKQMTSIIPKGFKGAVQYREDIIQRLAVGDAFLPEVVEVKGGRFWMGSAEEDENAQQNEKPRHLAEVSDFFIAKYPVTVREFACFVQETGHVTSAEREGWAVASWWDENTLSSFVNVGADWRCDVFGNPMDGYFASHPVIYVSWHDAQAYCKWFSQKTGKQYALPSEAQWEYAAIGGLRSGRSDEAGNIEREFEYAGSDDLNEVAWNSDRFSGTARKQYGTRPVGSLKPNQLGLYDMSGNVYEWCKDWYADYLENAEKDYAGPEYGSGRVIRGGGWNNSAEYCRTANRYD
ncbi:MAG: SUMF1/EgtB/PvdO family nonheme iron enzyme, partial [Saprospiraceae bacterium]|nr:SUMF1/EgtB/PvdO family nonheme iron enzyme [Saprospiraceae bacterium]